MTIRLALATPPAPGAIAIIHLQGRVEPLLGRLAPRRHLPVGALSRIVLADVDDGVIARPAPDHLFVMPHGGPRVVDRVIDHLRTLGARSAEDAAAAPAADYPEAADDIEALMLAALARARSPAAIDALLAQPPRWRAPPRITARDRARSRRLDRLLEPAVVVLVGPPNVGKSTLSNRLLGRGLSITDDAAGTTRDYTCALVDLAGLLVSWHDTPGRRATDDAVERAAIDLAAPLLGAADLVVAMTDVEHDWPPLERAPDLRVGGRADRGRRDDADLTVSGATGEGVPALVAAIRERLVPAADASDPGPWIFDPRLESTTGDRP